MVRIFFLFSLLLKISSTSSVEFCSKEIVDGVCESSSSNIYYKQIKYLLYGVNPGEGFNLRRDVYMRMASVVKQLNKESKINTWTLVLPPWGPLYHWKSTSIQYQSQIKWSAFFDVSYLQQYVPVVEFEDFLEDNFSEIHALYYLQNYAEGWSDGKWEERVDIEECVDSPPYIKSSRGTFTGWFWGYEDIFAKEFYCLSIQGSCSTLKRFLESTNLSVIMVDRAEVILHDRFGDSEYWTIRRSMVFASHLVKIADDFRISYLNSSDVFDQTERTDSLFLPITRQAKGGPYAAVHLRRQDFTKSRPNEVPSIRFAAKQISKKMKKLNLTILYVATDGLESEFEELQNDVPGSVRYVPDKNSLEEILDGGVAIIDQWICAHSRYFIGSFESTFSFRIQEEREILGFPVETTFNRLCGTNQTSCEQPAKWTIVFS